MRVVKKVIIIMAISFLFQQNPILHAQRTEARLDITVDPRIELINIVMTFTKMPFFGKITDLDYKYYNDVIEHFAPYKNHEAVQWCEDFPYFLDISFPAQMMLYLSDPPEMKIKYDPPPQATKQMIDDISKTVDLLNRFAVESQFMDFWEQQQPFYNRLINDIKNRLPYEQYLKIVKDFFGKSFTNYICVISPILFGAAFGPHLETKEGSIPYFVTGPNKIEQGKPIFTERWLRLLIFHEFGHSYVNPLCEKNRDVIEKHNSLFQHFLDNPIIKENYEEWFIVCHEHIVRACEYLLLKKAGLASESEENLQKNLNQGFALIPLFTKKLEYYDSHKDEFPTFESYFPELLKTFDEIPSTFFETPTKKESTNVTSIDTLEVQANIDDPQKERVNSQVDAFFKHYNNKDIGEIKALLSPNVSVSGNKGEMAVIIIESAVKQLPKISNYEISKILKKDGNIQVIGKYFMGGNESDYTFILNSEEKFIEINMFEVKRK